MERLEDLTASPLIRTALTAAGYPERGWQVLPLKGDGSDRNFYRLRKGQKRLMALHSRRLVADGVDENDSYHLIGSLMAECGLPVPVFHWASPEHGLFLMEDVGDLHLQRFLRYPRVVSSVESVYKSVLKALIRMHRLIPPRFSEDYCFDGPSYDASFVYRRELEYFRNVFLEGFLGRTEIGDGLRVDFEKLAEEAATMVTNQVLHRDFQSRNLMVHGGRLRMLDFQGMRFGPSVYDLASLLLDPYVDLDEACQERLVKYYWSAAHGIVGATSGATYRRFRRHYEVVRLCRNLQVLGAYAFLSKTKGKPFFAQFIPKAWSRLVFWLQRPFAADFPRLVECVRELEADPECRWLIHESWRRPSESSRHDRSEPTGSLEQLGVSNTDPMHYNG